MKSFQEQIKKIPQKPGVYFFKNKKGKILYIGKAADLKKRVSQYFQKPANFKFLSMLKEISKINFLETNSEILALLLESEMIKRYKPKYNERLKDEKNFLWLKITLKEDWPKVFFVRRPLPDENKYFGPFTDASSLRKSLRALRRIFPYISVKKFPHRICFWGHLKQCPCYGMEKDEYLKSIKNLIKFLSSRTQDILKNLEKEMKKAALNKEFEKAALLRDRILALKKISLLSLFQDEFEISKDQAIEELCQKLNLPSSLYRIECYDVSNLLGKEATGSLVVFQGGLPKKEAYRKFKIKKISKIDDYAMIKEILERRFLRLKKGDEKFKILPDLIIIDGGRGQVNAALKILEEFKLNIPTIGLAKKNEEIFLKKNDKFKKIIFPKDSHALFLLQRIRDEAHRFALIYHRLLREKKIKN